MTVGAERKLGVFAFIGTLGAVWNETALGVLSATMLCCNILELLLNRGMDASMDSLCEALVVLVKGTMEAEVSVNTGTERLV